MNDSELLEFGEVEVEEVFLTEIENRIQYIEQTNMWKLPFKAFAIIDKECANIIKDIKRYEKRYGCEFECFKEYERRIRVQANRSDKTGYRVGYGWIPWDER